MRDAISRNQSQSVAISRNQSQSGELELAPDEGRNRTRSGRSSGAISEAREISSSESRDISLGISRSHPSKSNQRQSEVIRCNQISLDLARTLRSRTSGSCSASAARRARSRASRARDRSRSQIRSSRACSSGRGSRRKSEVGRRCVAAAQVRTSVDQRRSASIRIDARHGALNFSAHHSAHLQCPSQRAHLPHKCHRREDARVERHIGRTVDAIQVDPSGVGAVVPSVDAIWSGGGMIPIMLARLSEAIRGHQRPSEAIRGHQRPSEAIRGHQRPSEAIRGHQRPSEAIRGQIATWVEHRHELEHEGVAQRPRAWIKLVEDEAQEALHAMREVMRDAIRQVMREAIREAIRDVIRQATSRHQERMQ